MVLGLIVYEEWLAAGACLYPWERCLPPLLLSTPFLQIDIIGAMVIV